MSDAPSVPLYCKLYTCMPILIGMATGYGAYFLNYVPEFMPLDMGTMVNQHGATVVNPNFRTWGTRNSLPAAIHLWALINNTPTAYVASFLAATWREVGDVGQKFYWEGTDKAIKEGTSFMPFLIMDIVGLYFAFVAASKVKQATGGVPLACKIYSCMPILIGMATGYGAYFLNYVPEFMPLDMGTMVNQHGATVVNPNFRTWGTRNSLPAAIHLWALINNTPTAYVASFLAATWREVGDVGQKFYWEGTDKAIKEGTSFMPFLIMDIVGLYFAMKSASSAAKTDAKKA